MAFLKVDYQHGKQFIIHYEKVPKYIIIYFFNRTSITSETVILLFCLYILVYWILAQLYVKDNRQQNMILFDLIYCV